MDLFVKVGEGSLAPLSECHWARFSPAGCAHSSAAGDEALTAEDAHRQFQPRQRDRDRETRTGWTVQLLSRAQWKERAASCFYGTCAHRTASDGTPS